MQIQKWLLLFLLVFTGISAFSKELCEIETETDTDEPTIATDLFKVRLNDGMEFQLNAVAPDGEDKLANMGKEQRERFLQRRHEVLTSVARSLAYPRVLGFVPWAQKKFKKCAQKSLAEAFPGITFSDDISLGDIRSEGYAAIARALRTIDAVLWEDIYVVTHAKSVMLSTYISASAGLAVRRLGFLGWHGLEFDFAYDFQRKTRFRRLSWVKQSLRDSFYLFEAIVSFGVLVRQYELDPNLDTQAATSIHTPVGLMIRRGPSVVGLGGVLAVTAFDILGLGMATAGHSEAAAAMFTIPRIVAMGSTYTGNIEKKTLLRWDCRASLSAPANP
jgi:hypothetical protein